MKAANNPVRSRQSDRVPAAQSKAGGQGVAVAAPRYGLSFADRSCPTTGRTARMPAQLKVRSEMELPRKLMAAQRKASEQSGGTDGVPKPHFDLQFAIGPAMAESGAGVAIGTVLQRKLEFAYGGGVITKCNFTTRPSWTREVRDAMPSAVGYDRGHLVPWAAEKEKLQRNMVGKSMKQAFEYLRDECNQEPATMTWAAIEAAIKAYAREVNSDLDNLEYEDSAENRSAGAKIPSARMIWDAIHGTGGQSWNPPYQVSDRDGDTMTLNTVKEATVWCQSVGFSDAMSEKEKKKAAQEFTPAGSHGKCIIM